MAAQDICQCSEEDGMQLRGTVCVKDNDWQIKVLYILNQIVIGIIMLLAITNNYLSLSIKFSELSAIMSTSIFLIFPN